MKTSTLALVACSTTALLVAGFAAALPSWHASAGQRAEEAELTALVQAMSDPRPAIADVAASDLQNAIDEWQSLPPEVASLRVARLANLLAHHCAAIPARQRHAVRSMARRLLLWPLHSEADAGQLIADCEATLRVCKPMPPDDIVSRVASATMPNGEEVQLYAAEPQSPVPVEAIPEGDERVPALIAAKTESSLQPSASTTMPPARLFEPPPIAVVEPRRFIAPRAARHAVTDDSSSAGHAPEEDPPDVAVDRYAYLHDLADVEVMRHLHGTDPERVAAAKAELASRGYQARHFPLATALTHPDAARRRRLAESLPLLRGIDPRPWLLQLQADPDPEVRHAADSILQTGLDPATSQR